MVSVTLDQATHLLEASGSPCLLVDPDAKILYATRALKEVNFEAFRGVEGRLFSDLFDVLADGQSLIEAAQAESALKLYLRHGDDLGSWRVSALEPLGFVISVETQMVGVNRQVFEGLEDFVQNSREGFLKTRLTGEIIEANSRLCEMLGYSRKEVFQIGNMADFFFDLSERQEMITEALEKGHSRGRIQSFRKKNGSTLYGEVSAVLIHRKGEEPFLTGYIVDVTDRVIAEKEARRAQDLISRMMDSTEDGIFVTDLNGVCLLANRSLADISGIPYEQLMEGERELVLPFDKKPGNDDTNIIIDRGGTIIEEEAVEFPDGTSRAYHISRSPIRNDQGDIFATFGVVRDITDNYQLRRQLEESFERFKVFIEEIPFAAAMFDAQAKYVTYSNKWARDFHGGLIDPESVNFFQQHPFLQKHFAGPIESCLRGQTCTRDSDHYVDDTGETHYFRWSMVPWADDNKIKGFILTVESLDAARKMESALEQERAKSLRNSKLAALGEMATAIAHEINNPLAIIQTSNDLVRQYLLREEIPVENSLVHIDRVRNTVERVSRIIRSLMNVSRDSYSEPLQPAVVAEIVEDSTLLYREKFRLQLIDFELDMDEDELELVLFCKRVQIAQIIINLLSNALDAVKDAEVKKIVFKGRSSGGFFEFRLVDSGGGIDEAVADKIFDPFFTTKPYGEGTGLGLSISRELAVGQGCELYLDKEAENTCFVLRVPLRQLSVITE